MLKLYYYRHLRLLLYARLPGSRILLVPAGSNFFRTLPWLITFVVLLEIVVYNSGLLPSALLLSLAILSPSGDLTSIKILPAPPRIVYLLTRSLPSRCYHKRDLGESKRLSSSCLNHLSYGLRGISFSTFWSKSRDLAGHQTPCNRNYS